MVNQTDERLSAGTVVNVSNRMGSGLLQAGYYVCRHMRHVTGTTEHPWRCNPVYACRNARKRSRVAWQSVLDGLEAELSIGFVIPVAAHQKRPNLWCDATRNVCNERLATVGNQALVSSAKALPSASSKDEASNVGGH